MLHRVFVQFAAHPGDSDRVGLEAQPASGVGGLGFQQAVAGLLGATGLRDDHAQRAVQVSADDREHLVHSVGIGVVKEMNRHAVLIRLPEGVGDELWPQRRAADAHDEQPLERPARAPDRFAGVDFRRELFDGGEGVLDFLAQLRCGR